MAYSAALPAWKPIQGVTSAEWSLAGIIIVLAGCVRFWGLGTWPLAVDEYFLTVATLATGEHGYPLIRDAGIYPRGLLQQYLSLPFHYFLNNTELASRILPALSSIGVLIVMYCSSRRFFDRRVAFLCLVALAFSVWQVEFARFARMYSMFQLIAVVHTFLLIDLLLSFNPKKMTALIALAAVSVVTYEGSAFLLVLSFVPLIFGRNVPSQYLGFWIGALLLALAANVGLDTTDWRHLFNSEPHLPDGYVPEASSNIPLLLPSVILLDRLHSLALVVGIFLQISLLTFAIWRTLKRESSSHPGSKIVVFVLFSLVALNQYFAAGLVLVIGIAFGVLPRHIVLLNSELARVYLSNALLLAILPIASFVIGWNGQTYSLADIPSLFLKWPDIYYRVWAQWYEAMPVNTVAVFALLVANIFQTLFSNRFYDQEPNRYLLGCVLTLLAGIGFIDTTYPSPKYSYFLYPLILLLGIVSAVDIAKNISGWIYRKPSRPQAATWVTTVICALFALTYAWFSEDQNVKHLLTIDSAKTNFRTEYSRAYRTLLYPRTDFRGAADFINQHLKPGHKVVTLNMVVIDFYLDQLDLVYWMAASPEFSNYSVRGGTIEFWTGAQMTYSYEQLKTFACAAPTTWLVMPALKQRYHHAVEDQVRSDFGSNKVFTSQDGFLEVYRLAGCS